MTPGCTTATKSRSLSSSTRFMRARESATPPARGHAAADVAVARAARRHGNTAFRAKSQQAGNILRRAREHDRFRRVAGEPFVARVRGERGRVVGDGRGVRFEQPAQFGDERSCACQRKFNAKTPRTQKSA